MSFKYPLKLVYLPFKISTSIYQLVLMRILLFSFIGHWKKIIKKSMIVPQSFFEETILEKSNFIGLRTLIEISSKSQNHWPFDSWKKFHSKSINSGLLILDKYRSDFTLWALVILEKYVKKLCQWVLEKKSKSVIVGQNIKKNTFL